MPIYAVGLIKKGKKTEAIKMLQLNLETGAIQICDINYNKVVECVKNGSVKVENLKVEHNEIKGVNGSLDRYGVLGKSQALVILTENKNNNGEDEYFCSDANGNTRLLNESTVIAYADKIGLANGKVVNEQNGKRRISAIEGNYIQAHKKQSGESVKKQGNETNTSKKEDSKLTDEIKTLISNLKSNDKYKNSYIKDIVITVEKNDRCSSRQKYYMEKEWNAWNKQPNTKEKPEDLPDNIKELIKKAKTYKQYEESSCKSIVNTIEKSKHCSYKQKAAIQFSIDKWEKETKQPEKETKQPEKETKQPEKETKQPEKEDKKTVNNDVVSTQTSMPKPKVLNRDAFEILNNDDLIFEKMQNGKLYVTGLKNKSLTDLSIPDRVEIDNKEYKVEGIGAGAFSETSICRVVTGPNIVDIGQRAFDECKSLLEIDLSRSKHTHIPKDLCYGCKKLKSVSLGSNIERIHEDAFLGCISLEYIEIPSSCDTIARQAFRGCSALKNVYGTSTYINEAAFMDCISLNKFDFSGVNYIGSRAFKNTAFEHLILPGNITKLGDYAFADCVKLSQVDLEEGIEEIGSFCFAKHDIRELTRKYGDKCKSLKIINTPKSIKDIKDDVFRHADLVNVWTGSICESHCISMGVPYNQYDKVDTDNSTGARVKNVIMQTDLMPTIYRKITTPDEMASNTYMELNTKKLKDIKLKPEQVGLFGITASTGEKKPHIKFVAMVNLLEELVDFYDAPITVSVLRLEPTFNVKSSKIYDDECNKIYKVTYEIKDTLESGSFIMVLMNDSLKFIAPCEASTDIKMTTTLVDSDLLPIQNYLHVGDTLGEDGVMDGLSGKTIVKVERNGREFDQRVNVGKIFMDKLNANALRIDLTQKNSVWYIPCRNVALKIYDGRKWQNGKVVSGIKNCVNITGIIDYETMVQELKSFKKTTVDNKKFFADLAKLSNAEVEYRNKSIIAVEEEKEAHLYRISKQFIELMNKKNISESNVNPNDLTYDIFKQLTVSYWMIPKDKTWLSQVGKKSLNKTHEYKIEKYTLTEFRSNQVVKFSNPYMNGVKGAYIFTISIGSMIYGIYASRYSMQEILNNLVKLTYIRNRNEDELSDDLKQNPIKNAEEFNRIPREYFSYFYSVADNSDGWNLGKYVIGSLYFNKSFSFSISMYKPNGIFYLVANTLSVRGNIAVNMEVIPILPIGNMDRALMVAGTTNKSTRSSKFVESLMSLMIAIEANGRSVYYTKKDMEGLNAIDGYIAARKLILAGDKDINKYLKILDSRAVYMLGTVHKGKLQREKSWIDREKEIEDEIEDGIDLDDIDIEDEIDLDDIDIDIDIDDID